MRNNTRRFPAGTSLAGLVLVLALVFVVDGCQTVPVAPAPAQAWNVRRPALQNLSRFGLNGRVAVAVGSQGFNAGLRWTQSAAVTHLTLTGPLGAGGVDFPAVFQILRERQYDGWVTLDFDAPRPGEGTVEQDMNSHKKYLLETLHADLRS